MSIHPPRRRRAAGTVAFVFVLCACAAAFAQPADLVGLFFGDPASGIHERETVSFPTFDTAYLVLMAPSQPDVGGWELRVRIDGAADFLDWQLAGQAVNFETAPDFLVGLGSPLPAVPQVVLAHSDVMVTGPGPVTFSLLPLFVPSLPGAMAYIPFDDKEALTPLLPWTGEPAVAFYNRNATVCTVSASSLSFGVVPLNSHSERSLTVTNTGGGSLHVDAEIDGTWPPFRILAGGDPVDLAAGQQHVVTLEFTPTEVGDIAQALDLGTGCAPVALWGRGRLPTVELTCSPPAVDFGEVLTGNSVNRTVTARNTGEAPVYFRPQLPDSCDAFTLGSSGPFMLQPGAEAAFGVTFAPLAPGDRTCAVDLADGTAPLPLHGLGLLSAAHDLVIDPVSLDFGTIFTGTTNSRAVTLTNIGAAPITVDLNLPVSCPAYTVWPMDTSVTIAPGTDLVLQVQFHPLQQGPAVCTVSLGTGMPGIAVTGRGIAYNGSLRLQPASLDFGGVAVGSWAGRTVTIVNETGAVVTLTPSAGEPGGGFGLSGSPATITLPTGGRYTLTVLFQPELTGPYAGALSMGAGLPTVALAGTGEEPVDGLAVEPAAVDFGSFYVNAGFTDRSVAVTNTGNQTRAIDIRLADPNSPFHLLYGGLVQIQPGVRHTMLIRFMPGSAQSFSDQLLVGDAAVVPVAGLGVTDAPHCFVHTGSLEFGIVQTGATAVQTTYVSNTGNTSLDLVPEADCGDFVFVGAPVVLEPGNVTPLQVAFNPTTAGEQVCILDLGPSICTKVILFGEGRDSLIPDHDLVGVWFDPELTTGIRRDLRIGEAVPAWLAMLNPSETVGVSGWELRLDLDDGLYLAGHTLAGQAFNIEQPPSFFVGLAAPLPYAPQVVLATFDFLVTDTDMHAVDVVPLSRPSIPGGLAWIFGADFQLKEMYPVSGAPSVAWLSATASVPVSAPTPAARLAGGRVELDWRLPGSDGDGCHVYRLAGGAEIRLTTEPLAPDGRSYRYVDDVGSLPRGTRVVYSYGIVHGSAVVARSPGVTVELPGTAVLASRLLPNRPNPFNPETELHYELARGGHVRLAVFDVSGRRIAVLEDGVREAGAHQVVWRGRDDAGRGVPSGAYYVQLETTTGRDTRKVMLLK